MFKVKRPLAVGGAVVVGVLLSGSVLFASPQAPSSDFPKFRVQQQISLQTSYGDRLEKLKQSIGVPEVKQIEQTVQVAAVEKTTPPPKPVPAKTVKAQTKPKAKLQVASRSATVHPVDKGLVSYALGFRGVPYVYGGTTPSGFDCSGFTQYVFRKYGISLLRTSQQQFTMGSSVRRNELKPGDLVFFKNTISGQSGATHVGIYIGNGQFVHASGSKGITTTPLSDPWYVPKYLGAKRINK